MVITLADIIVNFTWVPTSVPILGSIWNTSLPLVSSFLLILLSHLLAGLLPILLLPNFQKFTGQFVLRDCFSDSWFFGVLRVRVLDLVDGLVVVLERWLERGLLLFGMALKRPLSGVFGEETLIRVQQPVVSLLQLRVHHQLWWILAWIREILLKVHSFAWWWELSLDATLIIGSIEVKVVSGLPVFTNIFLLPSLDNVINNLFIRGILLVQDRCLLWGLIRRRFERILGRWYLGLDALSIVGEELVILFLPILGPRLLGDSWLESLFGGWLQRWVVHCERFLIAFLLTLLLGLQYGGLVNTKPEFYFAGIHFLAF